MGNFPIFIYCLWVRVRLEEQTYPFPFRKITSATMFSPPVLHVRQVLYPSLVTIHCHFITDHRGNYCLSRRAVDRLDSLLDSFVSVSYLNVICAQF